MCRAQINLVPGSAPWLAAYRESRRQALVPARLLRNGFLLLLAHPELRPAAAAEAAAFNREFANASPAALAAYVAQGRRSQATKAT